MYGEEDNDQESTREPVAKNNVMIEKRINHQMMVCSSEEIRGIGLSQVGPSEAERDANLQGIVNEGVTAWMREYQQEKRHLHLT